MTPTNERHCVNSASVKFVKGVPPAGFAEAKVL
jgi:peptide methionine sulfoxide reductase MsrB